MELADTYDVVVLGGGLAGLTLARQLKQSRPVISVLVLEKRNCSAPVATHKVGESTSELGASYLRDVLKLSEYLTGHQLRKFGFRFFFSPEHSDDIARRVEVGSRIPNPYPTHQIDRGIFENDLEKLLRDDGVNILLGATVQKVNISSKGHTVDFVIGGKQLRATGTWVVDSSGRRSLLKRTLGLVKESDHIINSSWFRVESDIDIDDWSDNPVWRSYVDPGRRRLATNHLMGEGYWVWIIALISGCTSIGIVADPRYHPFNTFNTYEKAMRWLTQHEPLAARMLSKTKDRVMDFKVMKNFAYDCKQFYSTDRWAVSGEAGAFLDPFYSPGTDFIALGNTWITDLVTRDLAGEDIHLRTLIYEHTHRELLNGWLNLYYNQYGIFGKTQVMVMKIVWDWAAYWAVPNIMFMNNGYTDIAVLKQYSSASLSIGRRFGILNERMQGLFRTWGKNDSDQYSDSYHNVFDLNCLNKFQTELSLAHQLENVMEKIRLNLGILEQIAAEIFRRASARIYGTPIDMRVDPYTMSIDDEKDLLLAKSSNKNALEVVDSIQSDIATMWLRPVNTKSSAYAQ